MDVATRPFSVREWGWDMNTVLGHASLGAPLVDLSAVPLSTLRTMNSPELQRALRRVVEQSATPQFCEMKLDSGWHH
jgi:FXSXX-COOH protein